MGMSSLASTNFTPQPLPPGLRYATPADFSTQHYVIESDKGTRDLTADEQERLILKDIDGSWAPFMIDPGRDLSPAEASAWSAAEAVSEVPVIVDKWVPVGKGYAEWYEGNNPGAQNTWRYAGGVDGSTLTGTQKLAAEIDALGPGPVQQQVTNPATGVVAQAFYDAMAFPVINAAAVPSPGATGGSGFTVTPATTGIPVTADNTPAAGMPSPISPAIVNPPPTITTAPAAPVQTGFTPSGPASDVPTMITAVNTPIISPSIPSTPLPSVGASTTLASSPVAAAGATPLPVVPAIATAPSASAGLSGPTWLWIVGGLIAAGAAFYVFKPKKG